MAARRTHDGDDLACVELGFVDDPASPASLLPFFFPSKVGGKPAWLDLKNIPSENDLRCNCCSKITAFVLQFYAPKEKEDCFHRVIFVFCCKDPSCHKKNDNSPFHVLRCQLPRENIFFDYEPFPKEASDSTVEECYRNLLDSGTASRTCSVCGCRGGKQCAKCHSCSYCSREHQVLDWNAGHKQICKEQESGGAGNRRICTPSSFSFPEMELVTEPEPGESHNATEECTDEQKRKIDPSFDSLQMTADDSEKLEELTAASSEVVDKKFQCFQQRISREPTQVLRYQPGGKPLWVSKHHIPASQGIPKCDCGSPRQFEFQVLPQLLGHLQVDSIGASIDWGTLVVYTCEMDCSHGNKSYHQEFLWKQDYSEVDIVAAAR